MSLEGEMACARKEKYAIFKPDKLLPTKKFDYLCSVFQQVKYG